MTNLLADKLVNVLLYPHINFNQLPCHQFALISSQKISQSGGQDLIGPFRFKRWSHQIYPRGSEAIWYTTILACRPV